MDKIVIYKKEELINNIKLIIDEEVPLISNLSNISSLIYQSLEKVSWCGFYLSNEKFNTLYLGPYQGNVACTTIPFGKGVCGTSAILKQSQLVPNVHDFPGHIACSSSTNSEIVIPIIKDNKCYGVLDLDSDDFENFTVQDQHLLEEVCKIISYLFKEKNF